MLKINDLTIGFAGLSHLGLTHSIGSAEKGFNVIAYDNDEKIITELSSKRINIEEPYLNKLLDKNKKKITFTNEIKNLVNCDIVYISKDVPTNSDGESELNVIDILISKVLKNLKKDAILIVLCQVSPGFTRLIKSEYNHVYYQVETLIFGEAINRFLYPERIIVGCADSKIPLDERYQHYLSFFECSIFIMNYESAELAKISINLFLVSSVTVTNILSEVSENIGADWDQIVPALRADKRIGKFSYIASGLGISGGNLERDLNSIIKIGKQNNTYIKTIETFVENSNHRKNWLYDVLIKSNVKLNKSSKIGILGLSYKANTDSVKNSPSLNLINRLVNCNIKVHDPMAKVALSKNVFRVETINQCIEGSDVLILATPWEIYKNIKVHEIKRLMRGKIIIDPYRLLTYEQNKDDGFTIFCLGKKN
jgi:UDPglucose 6-dehydrogenase